jgi:hypothetical protein
VLYFSLVQLVCLSLIDVSLGLLINKLVPLASGAQKLLQSQHADAAPRILVLPLLKPFDTQRGVRSPDHFRVRPGHLGVSSHQQFADVPHSSWAITWIRCFEDH